MDYANFEELHNLIKEEIADKYVIASANIIYLEELQQTNYVVFITQFRDVLTHLTNIYLADDINVSKEYVLSQVERAKGHIERITIDTFVKISELLFKKIKRITSSREFVSYQVQIAQKIKALRLSDNSLSFEQKCSGYRELIKTLEEIINSKN